MCEVFYALYNSTVVTYICFASSFHIFDIRLSVLSRTAWRGFTRLDARLHVPAEPHA